MKLRSEYRIVGTFDGAIGEGLCSSFKQNLPLRLSKVETQFLLKCGVIETQEVPSLNEIKPPVAQDVLETLSETKRSEQV